MSIIVPKETAVAFYSNRNRLSIERELDFSPDLPELPDWVEPEVLIDSSQMETYTGLCKLAIATTTRILFLPPEKNFMRALVTGSAESSHKPTGGYCEVTGPNFRASFGMGDVDFAHFGLGYSSPSKDSYLSFGNTASVDGHFRLRNVSGDDHYHALKIGQSACVIDRGSRYPERIAGPEVVQAWIDEVLTPIEEEIKARSYEWHGDAKTDPHNPERIV